MSQSEVHRRLVVDTSKAIQELYPRVNITKDILENPGDDIPQIVGNYRPDIFARTSDPRIQIVIAEAKTHNDLKHSHTLCQIDAFIKYLESKKATNGTFILAVSGHNEFAKTILNFNFRERVTENLHIKLFDYLDFWDLGPLGEKTWRLF